MHSRLALVPAALAVAALIHADVAPASHGCPTRSTATVEIVKRTPEAVVFARAPRQPSTGGPSKLSYGCQFRKGSTYRLNFVSDPGGFDLVRGFRLTGRFVAYENDIASAAGPDFPVVVVRDLVSGRVLRQLPASDDADSSYGAWDIEVKRNGSVAWIGAGTRADRPRYEVHVADRAGERMVDAGEAIEPRSLELAPDRTSIRWRRMGEARSAPID
jgi:hypothetical protein